MAKKFEAKELLHRLALTPGLTTYHYKIIMYLWDREARQVDVAQALNMSTSNACKVIKELEAQELITVTRKEGRNRYITTNLSWMGEQVPGQMHIDQAIKV